jgi:hypothetical protein
MVHREFVDPLGQEFRRLIEEQNLGLPLDICIAELSESRATPDLLFSATAMPTQKRTGRNLPVFLEKLSSAMKGWIPLRTNPVAPLWAECFDGTDGGIVTQRLSLICRVRISRVTSVHLKASTPALSAFQPKIGTLPIKSTGICRTTVSSVGLPLTPFEEGLSFTSRFIKQFGNSTGYCLCCPSTARLVSA